MLKCLKKSHGTFTTVASVDSCLVGRHLVGNSVGGCFAHVSCCNIPGYSDAATAWLAGTPWSAAQLGCRVTFADAACYAGIEHLCTCSNECQQAFLDWSVDSVCHKKVSPAFAVQTTYHGQTYDFCSSECATKLAEAPASWLEPESLDSRLEPSIAGGPP